MHGVEELVAFAFTTGDRIENVATDTATATLILTDAGVLGTPSTPNLVDI
jgi:hypothetical protein